ncbi:hypothetical protein Vretimale_10563 [Volvox reticuliferus]|uniref:Peptidase S8/S53 domain-containing protein n=2 Tax=Volvox reticuliferus TaxID=1737510 RepID=A0A8J4FPM4_9CHLO|nr:hypothetical protein Vretifemale_12524 [Volvox reticuliferus]GIM06166.1 hypothetical protein Vretimale_10563 [Volvox reticuliferus]
MACWCRRLLLMAMSFRIDRIKHPFVNIYRMAYLALFTVCAIAFLSIEVVATKEVPLRTGTAVLMPADPEVPPNNTEIDISIFPPYAWGSLPASELYLISYENDAQAELIHQNITMVKGRVISYFPVNTFLVFAKAEDVWALAVDLNTSMALYGPECKVAPELPGLLQSDSLSQAVLTRVSSNITIISPNGTASAPAVPTSSSNDTVISFNITLQYGLLVELVPTVTPLMMKYAGNCWPKELVKKGLGKKYSKRHPCWPVMVTPSASVTLAAYLCKEDLEAGISWFTALTVTREVYPMLRYGFMNLLSGSLLQTDRLGLTEYGWTKDPYGGQKQFELTADESPYWSAGLQGQGEIAGIGDTGVDVDQCYLQDPKYEWLRFASLSGFSDAPTIGSMVYWRMPDHRKIVQYAFNPAYGDPFDDNGHGTMCAGSIAGAVLMNGSDPDSPLKLTLATGVAPRARLSVVDFMQPGSSGLAVPTAIDMDYLPVHAAANATISSDSWGSLLGGYNAKARGFDMYLWKNPDFISIIAAGNYGEQAPKNDTIASPAVAKNVVAVGAGYRVPTSAGLTAGVYVIRAVQNSESLPFDRTLILKESPDMPLLATVIPSGTLVEVAVADPITACTPLNNAAQVAGRIVLVRKSSSCSISDQGLNVLAAKGTAMIVVQSTADKPYGPMFNYIDIVQFSAQIPISMIYKYFGDNLIDYLTSSGRAQLFVTGVVVPVDMDNVAEFSSWGPTYDGRIKPDIIAPGKDIMSPMTSLRFGRLCDYDTYWGTSAATPLVAGAVAIMRQYLRMGFYPIGAPNKVFSTPFAPSGMLLKALVIAGAKSLQGSLAMAAGELMGPPPDGYQGWGRLSMSGSLPLEGFTDPRVRLQVLDRGNFSLSGQNVTVRGLEATGTGPISIVLAYYDYPADVNAPTALVNNLNLIVKVNGRNYYGNTEEDTDQHIADSVNTVEKVLLKSPQPGADISIVVEAPSLPSSILDPTTPQRWAVAVVGHFSGYLESQLNPFWAKWGRGMPPSPPPPVPPMPPRPPPSPAPSPAPPRPPPTPPSPRPPPRPPRPPRLPPSPPTPPSSPPVPPPSPPYPAPSPPLPPASPSPVNPSFPDGPAPPSFPKSPRAASPPVPSPPSPHTTSPPSPPRSQTPYRAPSPRPPPVPKAPSLSPPLPPAVKSPPRPPGPIKPPPSPRRPPNRPPSPPRRPPPPMKR